MASSGSMANSSTMRLPSSSARSSGSSTLASSEVWVTAWCSSRAADAWRRLAAAAARPSRAAWRVAARRSRPRWPGPGTVPARPGWRRRRWRPARPRRAPSRRAARALARLWDASDLGGGLRSSARRWSSRRRSPTAAPATWAAVAACSAWSRASASGGRPPASSSASRSAPVPASTPCRGAPGPPGGGLALAGGQLRLGGGQAGRRHARGRGTSSCRRSAAVAASPRPRSSLPAMVARSSAGGGRPPGRRAAPGSHRRPAAPGPPARAGRPAARPRAAPGSPPPPTPAASSAARRAASLLASGTTPPSTRPRPAAPRPGSPPAARDAVPAAPGLVQVVGDQHPVQQPPWPPPPANPAVATRSSSNGLPLLPGRPGGRPLWTPRRAPSAHRLPLPVQSTSGPGREVRRGRAGGPNAGRRVGRRGGGGWRGRCWRPAGGGRRRWRRRGRRRRWRRRRGRGGGDGGFVAGGDREGGVRGLRTPSRPAPSRKARRRRRPPWRGGFEGPRRAAGGPFGLDPPLVGGQAAVAARWSPVSAARRPASPTPAGPAGLFGPEPVDLGGGLGPALLQSGGLLAQPAGLGLHLLDRPFQAGDLAGQPDLALVGGGPVPFGPGGGLVEGGQGALARSRRRRPRSWWRWWRPARPRPASSPPTSPASRSRSATERPSGSSASASARWRARASARATVPRRRSRTVARRCTASPAWPAAGSSSASSPGGAARSLPRRRGAARVGQPGGEGGLLGVQRGRPLADPGQLPRLQGEADLSQLGRDLGRPGRAVSACCWSGLSWRRSSPTRSDSSTRCCSMPASLRRAFSLRRRCLQTPAASSMAAWRSSGRPPSTSSRRFCPRTVCSRGRPRCRTSSSWMSSSRQVVPLDGVLAFPRAVQQPGDGHLGVLDGQQPGGVVDGEGDPLRPRGPGCPCRRR